MRFNIYLNEEDEVKDAPEEKDPAQEDIKKIVNGVKMATDANKMNNFVKQAAAMYKVYGNGWLPSLKKALLVDIVPETVERFIKYVEEFAETLTHIK